MDTDQREIIEYLKSWPGQFVSRREICRRAGGKWRYREDPNWALPSLQTLVEDRVIEADDTGHYRLIKRGEELAKHRQRVWMSPAVKRILRHGSRNLVVIDLDKELDPEIIAAESGKEGKGQAICYLLDEQVKF